MQDSATTSTPIATTTKLDPDQGTEVDVTHYRGMIGSLLYLTASRPDIMYATCLYTRFQANPRESHLIAVKRIFRYLKGTPSLGLWYARESYFGLCGYSDADFEGYKIDMKSTSGSCQFLGGRLVSWFSKNQKSISTSTAEAEYIAAESCCAQIMWMRNQLLDYGMSYSKIPIYCENQSAIAMTGNPGQHSLTKHISIRYIVSCWSGDLPNLYPGFGGRHISGITFATNNFVVVLDHQELPNEFHIIQDFLASSPLKYALTEPARVSFKSVMQVWNTAVFGKGPSGTVLMSFEFNGVTHHVTPAIVEEALHLPILGDNVPDTITDSTLFEFVTKLGYNVEVKKYGSLFRTKLKREWNFFFDTISRCFLNKTSNFDALPSGSLKIGCSLIYYKVFDYGSFVLKSLSDRKADKLGYVCFIRFFQLIFCHLCPDVIFEDDVILPICRITEKNVKSLVNSDKANGFQGNAFIPDEVRLFLKEKMPTRYGSITDSIGQGETHPVPDPSIQPKHSLKQSTTTSTVSQKTLVVKAKKSARSNVSGRQSGSKDFSSTPLTKKKSQGVLIKKADRVEEVVVKRKLILGTNSDSEDDMSLSSKFKIQKEVADTAHEAVAQTTKPQKKRKLIKSRYHIPLRVTNTDGHATSNPDESSIPDAHANPDEKVVETASKLGFSPPPILKKRKEDEIVFKRQKKLKGSRPQEPELQSSSAAIEDPATQEPLTQSVSEGKADGMVTQEPFSQRENEDINIPAPQEPSSQSENAGKTASVSRELPDIAQGVSGIPDMEIMVENTITEGSTQEPLTQSVKAASEPQATQEPLVANTDASQSNPDSVAPDASGAHDAEPVLIQPLDSRPLIDPISDHQDKLKGIAIPDPDNTDDSDDSDDDDDDDVEKDQLTTALKSSLGTTHGFSGTFMTGKATTGKATAQDFSGPSATDPAEQLRRHEWDNEWYRSADPVSYPCALHHASYAASLIQNKDIRNHLKATTLLSKSLKDEIDSVKAANSLVRTDISQSLAKAPIALQLRVVDSHVKSLITEQSFINNRIDSLASKGEKVSQTKCTPDLVLRKDDDNSGNDGDDLVRKGETSDAAMIKSSRQTTQSESMQSTHVSDSGVRTVRTLVKSQILTEEQILTGDQILTPGHGQTLSTIPEGDEDVFIENAEDAANLFKNFKTKGGDVVTLYHTDKRVQQLFARKALSISTEEYPDLSQEEFLKQQKEIMESFNNHAAVRGRGRGRRGARRGRRSTQSVPRQTRSRGLRIKEITEDIQILKVPDTQIVRTTFHEDDSNPDTVQDPDESEILHEVGLLILSTVVDSHNSEVDEEEEARRREIRRTTDREFNLYVQRLIKSSKLLWKNGRRQQHQLEKSYVLEKEKDKKWKHIDTLECNRPINFQSGGIIPNLPGAAQAVSSQRSKALWMEKISRLKQMPHNTRVGIGHRDAEFLNMPYVDPHALVEFGGNLTSEHLNNLQAVDIVLDYHDGAEKKEKLLYFMKDGSVKKISIQELLVKTTKELKYVHYLLKWKNRVCKEWSDLILSTIRLRFDEGRNYDGNYTPMYLNMRDQEVEMQRGSAIKVMSFGIKQLTLNPDGKEIAYLLVEEYNLQRSSIQNLREAIYQIDEEDEELRNLKERLIQILEDKEENLLSNFLKMNLFYQRI
ncbi:hypothetical protein POM88_037649 [Heracleum sosnowskyi]|uniref:Copia protein n=1 Tax=Heracleum sosnowskyi TaxID=360622 RepID=A0AAD8HQH7_9APIA|nr:hypothetical protein POM88_037649 [Heracleum sosnowskyi]